jgi:hypothetical protein
LGIPTEGRNLNCMNSDLSTIICSQLESRTSVLGSANGRKKDQTKSVFSCTVGAETGSKTPNLDSDKSNLFAIAARQFSSNISKRSPTADQRKGSNKSDKSPVTRHPLDCETFNVCSVPGRNLGSNNSNLSPITNCNASSAGAAGVRNHRAAHCNLFPSITSRMRCKSMKTRTKAESIRTWANCMQVNEYVCPIK